MGKRIIALFCALLICVAFLPAGARAASGIAVQDLYEYDRTAMNYKKISTLNGNPCRGFSGKEEALDIILRYVTDIAENNPDLKKTTVYDKSYKDGSRFYSVSLVYTGKGNVSNSIEQNYMDNPTKGAVSVYFALNNGRLSGAVIIDKGMSFSDLGCRSDGSKATLPPDVQEALKDSQVLKELDSLGTNHAYVLRDGTASTSAEVSFRYNQDSQLDEFRIYNYYKNESIAFTVPHKVLDTGAALGKKELGIDNMLEKYCNKPDDFFGWKPEYKLGVVHDGDYYFLHNDVSNAFENAQIYVCDWNASEEYAVLYLKLTFSKKPAEIEVLVKFGIGEDNSYHGNAQYFELDLGKSVNMSFSGTVFGAKYELFRWEVLSGDQCVSLSNVKSKTCTIEGLAKGKAVIRVSYNYGVDEPDVLTGIPRNTDRTKSKDIILTVK